MLDFDNRRKLFIGKDKQETLEFAVDHWVHAAKSAIQKRGKFHVALSGGSTPKAIFEKLSQIQDLEWEKVFLFWSDERSVSPEDPDSNYKMAMEFFGSLPIPLHQIFRMKAEKDIQKNAAEYEAILKKHTENHLLDLVMLGMGEDGHTASLFPETEALEEKEKLVLANHVPQKNTWRMTFTFPCINNSEKIVIYALGKSKAERVKTVLTAPIDSPFPASKIGSVKHPAIWVLDQEAASKLELS